MVKIKSADGSTEHNIPNHPYMTKPLQRLLTQSDYPSPSSTISEIDFKSMRELGLDKQEGKVRLFVLSRNPMDPDHYLPVFLPPGTTIKELKTMMANAASMKFVQTIFVDTHKAPLILLPATCPFFHQQPSSAAAADIAGAAAGGGGLRSSVEETTLTVRDFRETRPFLESLSAVVSDSQADAASDSETTGGERITTEIKACEASVTESPPPTTTTTPERAEISAPANSTRKRRRAARETRR